MRLSSRIALVLVTIFALASMAIPAAAAPDAAGDDLNALAHRAVDLANQERAKAGLNPLKWNDQLAASGRAYAQEMASKTFFSHTGSDGSTPTDRAGRVGYAAYGWGGLYVGENLGRGYNTAESVHQAWMASEGHRQNLLLPKYREIGIGIAVAPDGTKYWAQEFGSRPKVLPIFINGDAGSTDSQQVSLALTDEGVSPWGSVSQITQMMVSNRADYRGASWEPFSKAKGWTLAGTAGTDTVYVRLRDANGQTVESNSAIQYLGKVALSVDQPEAIAEVASGLEAVAPAEPADVQPVEPAPDDSEG